jgi:hypothetical protein
MKLSLTFCVTNGKGKYYFSNMQAGIVDMQPNVRRYVALPQSRGGARFYTRDAMQGYDVVLFVLALAKTVTPRGSPPAVPGAARGASHKLFLFSYLLVAPRKAMTYTALLDAGAHPWDY